MKKIRSIPAFFCALALLSYVPSTSAADLLSVPTLADLVLVVKSERKLYLMRAGQVLRAIDIALGIFPKGPKRREGDFRTPEGRYTLEGRNPNSDYFLSIKISYPSDADRAQAKKARPSAIQAGSRIAQSIGSIDSTAMGRARATASTMSWRSLAASPITPLSRQHTWSPRRHSSRSRAG